MESNNLTPKIGEIAHKSESYKALPAMLRGAQYLPREEQLLI